jgi:hypothetical protein
MVYLKLLDYASALSILLSTGGHLREASTLPSRTTAAKCRRRGGQKADVQSGNTGRGIRMWTSHLRSA